MRTGDRRRPPERWSSNSRKPPRNWPAWSGWSPTSAPTSASKPTDRAAPGSGGGAGRADGPGRRGAAGRAGNAPGLRAAARPPLVEPVRPGARSRDRQAPRLRRARVPARLRAPRRPARGRAGSPTTCACTASTSLAELHAVLYLQSRRTVPLLNGQAEYATRVLPALADLMAAETRTGCQHHAARRERHAASRPRRRPGLTTGPERANPGSPRHCGTPGRTGRCSPAARGKKAPATRHGFLDATTDPDKITWWWRASPSANVAIATGRPGPGRPRRRPARQTGNGFAAFSRLRRAGLLDGASAIRPHPQRRAARLLRRHRAGQRASCPAITWTSAPAAATSSPRPPRSAAGPTRCSATRRATAGLDWARSPGCSSPSGSTAAAAAERPATPAASPPGWRGCTKATGTTACSGPPAAPWKRAGRPRRTRPSGPQGRAGRARDQSHPRTSARRRAEIGRAHDPSRRPGDRRKPASGSESRNAKPRRCRAGPAGLRDRELGGGGD